MSNTACLSNAMTDFSPGAPSPSVVAPSSDRIRYAQCWEDADVLLDGLDVQPGDTCLSIASAGDNALALLTRSPSRVIAIDVSEAQLACLALRVAAYRCLDHDGLLELVGSRPSYRRIDLYDACRPALDDTARAFWDDRLGLIREGIGAAGRFERYLRLFRKVFLPLCHSRERVERLLAPKTPAARRTFYDEVWDSQRWRLLLKMFCSETVLSRLGRDASFFEHVEGPIARRLASRIEYALTELDPSTNPYLQWILTGRHQTALPLALRKEHFHTIRTRLDRLSWHHVSLESFLDDRASHSIDRFNLSDVFEYVDAEHTREILANVARTGRSGGRAAYWNLFVDRSRPADLSHALRPRPDVATPLSKRDAAIFYGRFVVEEVLSARRVATTFPHPSSPTRRYAS